MQHATFDSSHRPPGAARRAVAGFAAVVAALVWGHAAAAVLHTFGPADAPRAALPLTLALVAATAAGCLPGTAGARAGSALLAGIAAAVAIAGPQPAALAAAGAVLLVAPAAALAAGHLARKLPERLDAAAGRRRLLAAVWVLVALAGVVQTGRLATWITDPESDWFLTTRHPFWAEHECLPAYVYGAELNRRGEDNVWLREHYPGLNPEAETDTRIAGMVPEDPYQYTPQFLLLPRTAIALTSDYVALRAVWFALNASLVIGIMLLLATWIGGAAGMRVGLLTPLVLVSVPVLHNLQYGQFHLATICLALAACIAFDRGRAALGGGLLAAAILAKLFPALLVVPLVARKRWRDLGWTAAFGVAITAVALPVVGSGTFAAFFHYHLPRLANGDATAFGEAWPELAGWVAAANQGLLGVFEKLSVMGLADVGDGIALWVNRLFLLGLAGLAFFAARRTRASAESPEHRLEHAVLWLGLLGLASLGSPGAFADYVPATAVWLLALVSHRMADSRMAALLLGVCWVLHGTLLGAVPFPGLATPELLVPASFAGLAALFGLFGWAVAERLRPATAEEPAVRQPELAAAA